MTQKPTDNIIPFPGQYYGDKSAAEMLHAIAKDEPYKAFVIAWPADGSRPTYHANTSDMPVLMMRVWQFIHKFFNGDFAEGREP